MQRIAIFCNKGPKRFAENNLFGLENVKVSSYVSKENLKDIADIYPAVPKENLTAIADRYPTDENGLKGLKNT